MTDLSLNVCVAVCLAASTWSSAAQTTIKLVDDNFSEYHEGRIVTSGVWKAESGLLNQCHRVSPWVAGNAMGVLAVNGYSNYVPFEPQTRGILSCEFDWYPGRGMWTVIGFKTPDAKWNQYQAAVAFEAVGGKIYIVRRDGKREPISSRALREGDATSPSSYRVRMTVYPDAEGGSYQVRVVGQEGEVARTQKMPFANDGKKPVSRLEVRSVGWGNVGDKLNGYLDNLVIEKDVSDVPVTLETVCEKWGHIYHYGKPVVIIGTATNLSEERITLPFVFDVKDPYGKDVFQKSKSMELGEKETVTWRETLPASLVKNYGLYRITFGAGRETIRVEAGTNFAVIAPSNAEADGFKSRFGVFQYPLRSEMDILDKIVDQMYDLGVRWVRLDTHWYHAEREKGTFDWDGGFPMGTFTDLAHKKGMHVMMELSNVTRWASTRPDSEGEGSIDTGRTWANVAPKDFADWKNFCAKAAERFKGKVVYYEIWNEPGAPLNYKNFSGFWRDSSENFIKMIKTAREGIQSVDSNAKIVVSGFRPVDIGGHFDYFAERVLPAVIDEIDVISFHSCGRANWGVKMFDFKLLTKQLGRPDIPFFDTESPHLSRESTRLVGEYLASWLKGVEKSFGFIYNLPRYNHASLVAADYTPGIGTVAYATMTRFLEGAEMEGTLIPAVGVRAYSLLKGNTRIVVAWSEVPGKTLTAEIGSADHTFDFMGNPGPEVRPGIYNINRVDVGNDPVYIMCNLDVKLEGLEQ